MSLSPLAATMMMLLLKCWVTDVAHLNFTCNFSNTRTPLVKNFIAESSLFSWVKITEHKYSNDKFYNTWPYDLKIILKQLLSWMTPRSVYLMQKRQVECPTVAYLRPGDKDVIEKIFPCMWSIWYYTIQIGTHNIAKSFGQFG